MRLFKDAKKYGLRIQLKNDWNFQVLGYKSGKKSTIMKKSDDSQKCFSKFFNTTHHNIVFI